MPDFSRGREELNLLDQDLNKTTTVEEARKILGKTAENLSDEEIQDQLTKIQFLAESWLDDYERSIFDGKTLAEVISS